MLQQVNILGRCGWKFGVGSKPIITTVRLYEYNDLYDLVHPKCNQSAWTSRTSSKRSEFDAKNKRKVHANFTNNDKEEPTVLSTFFRSNRYFDSIWIVLFGRVMMVLGVSKGLW
jgi:hypothetical protein